MKKISSIFVCLILFSAVVSAEEKVSVSGGADMVSSYVWRGSYNAGASFQPSLKVQSHGFTLGSWGSMDFVGHDKKEVDLSLNYSFHGITIGVTDYWWEGEQALKYFDYQASTTAHRWEALLAYRLPFEKFPLSLSWNTMFAGNDYHANGQRAYSTYVELDYPFAIGSVDMNASLGATPWHSPSILSSDNKGFSVCNVAIAGTKVFKLSENISIPVFSRLIFNPAIQDIHFVFGISLLFAS